MGVCVCAHISHLFHGHSCACLYSPPRVAMFAHIGFFVWVLLLFVQFVNYSQSQTKRRGEETDDVFIVWLLDEILLAGMISNHFRLFEIVWIQVE